MVVLRESSSSYIGASTPTTSSSTNAQITQCPPGLADQSLVRGMDLEKNGFAREALQAFQEAATMYQVFVDQNLNTNGFNEHVLTSRSRDEVLAVLGYIMVRLAHLSHDNIGNSKEAVRLYENALQIDPTPSSVSWHGLATSIEAATAGTELPKAIDAYREAIRLSVPGSSYRMEFHLAVALERQNALLKENGELLFESESIMEKLRRSGGADASCWVDSWEYVRCHTKDVPYSKLNVHRGTRDMLQLALDAAHDLIISKNGLVCEFGVATGTSMRMTTEILPHEKPVHGFDTFTGLPEAWGSEPAGTYSTGGMIPKVDGTVFFHQGLFSDTIPPFLVQNPGVPLAYANIDCDLYSSTYDIFELMHDRIIPGTVLIFDEYICHPTWREDEFRAWRECCQRFGWTYEYLGFSLSSKQAVVRVISTGK